MDQQLVDRVRDAIKTAHDVGNDWDVIARTAIAEVGYHIVGRAVTPWSRTTAADNTCKATPPSAAELHAIGKQASRNFAHG